MDGKSPDRYRLRLFVAGHTARSLQAIAHVREFCRQRFDDHCALEVIDVYQAPERAEADGVMAVPSLLLVEPPPVRRFVGDMSDPARLLAFFTDGEGA